MQRINLPTLVAAVACLGLAAGTARAGGEAFRPAPLASCDGTGWGGLRFGAVTPQTLKGRYRIASGNDIPRSLRLSAPGDTGVTVTALFDGKKDSDPLEAFCLRYAPGALDLATLQGDMGEDGEARYARERFGDWWVQVFPDKGVAAFVVRTPAGTDVPQVLLLPFAALPPAVHSLSHGPTPVGVLVDPHAGEPRVMFFGTTSVTGSIGGLHTDDDLKLRLERRMVDGTAGGAMRYAAGAPGRYTTALSGTYKPSKDSDIKVECTIQGTCPYGEVDASGSSEARIRAGDDPYRALRDTASDTMGKAEANYARAMSRQGPPTPEQVRAAAWDRLFGVARTEAAYAAAPHAAP